jgi:predicted alpha/beta-fold hydrolase
MHGPAPEVSTAHGQVVASGFRPHPLLRNPHLQTVAPLLRPLPPLEIRVERLELPDGDFIDVGHSGKGNGPIAVLLHGLTSGFDSRYLRGLARRLTLRGWRAAIPLLRGNSPEPNRLPRCYNHGDTGDFLHLCRQLQQREPSTPLYAAGWSMGANILLKALGEEGEGMPVRAAAAACAPFELAPCAEKLRTGFARVYQSKLMKGLHEMLKRRHGPVPVPPPADLYAAYKAPDFFAYDDAYTAPINGYKDSAEYYSRCSSGQFLARIRRPTLVVNAADDPFMVPSILPDATRLAPQVTLEIASHGGHVGFIGAGAGGRPRWWLEERLESFLLEAHGARAEGA